MTKPDTTGPPTVAPEPTGRALAGRWLWPLLVSLGGSAWLLAALPMLLGALALAVHPWPPLTRFVDRLDFQRH